MTRPTSPRPCFYCGEPMTRSHNALYCFPCKEIRGHGKAMQIVAQAIRRGELPHAQGKLCVDCGARAHGWDHRDYGKPLDVEPVCRSCNKRRGPALAAKSLRRAA